MWTKIKCFFGFCGDQDIITELQREAVRAAYGVEAKAENKIDEVKKKVTSIKDRVEDAQDFAEGVADKVKDAYEGVSDAVEEEIDEVLRRVDNAKKALTKPKRHWYNNGETQKLVLEDDEEKLSNIWKKGKCK